MDSINSARLRAGLSVSDACELLGVAPRTWRNWKRNGAPKWARMTLEILGGDLSYFGWNGWRIVRGRIYSPELRDGWTPEHLQAAWWRDQRLADLLTEQRRRLELVTDRRELERAGVTNVVQFEQYKKNANAT